MRIAMVVNAVSGGWDPRDRNSYGGGEEAFCRLAEAFVKRGHDVACFWQGEPMKALGCVWAPYPPDGFAMEPLFDVAIWRKTPEEVARWKLSERNYLWFDQTRPFEPAPFTGIVVASEFLHRILSQITPACASRLVVIPEGHSQSEYPRPDHIADVIRDPNLVLHASSPDRGLETLLRLWKQVREQRPDAKLLCTYDFDRFRACGGSVELIERLHALAAEAGGVEFAKLDADEMAKTYRRAGVWAYWCTGGEHYCHTAVKAQLSGAIPVVKPWGALHETVRSGFFVSTEDEFVETLVSALEPGVQRAHRDDHGRCLPTRGGTLLDATWDDIAARWEAEVLTRETAPPLWSQIRALPSAPPFGLPPGWNSSQMLWPNVAQWLDSQGVKRPWLDPNLGIVLSMPGGSPVFPRDGDAAVFGFHPEDDEDPLAFIRQANLKDGTRVAFLVGHGPWRAGQRRRVLERRDVLDLVGKQTDVTVRTIPIDAEGNSVSFVGFRLVAGRLGKRDVGRALRVASPRETLSACFIVLNAEDTFLSTLRSIQNIVDEICVVDTGSTDGTVELAKRFGEETGIPVQIQSGYNPRWCFDCLALHEVGDMAPGHRFAGFETPRNQSIAMAKGDWILWLDADEKLVGADNLTKYLRPNVFRGYSISQHHFSVDPPQAMKVDMPVRVFRRREDGSARGLFHDGPLAWPTFGTGIDVRFCGIVHEHPGLQPNYADGLGPVVVLGDVWIAHSGYYTEEARRRRFRRNWPLMAADRQKYPNRRLGRFLWLRDLCHHVRYLLELSGGRRSPEVDQLAEDGLSEWTKHFLTSVDPFATEAHQYASALAQILGRGLDVEVAIKARKPEVTGQEQAEIALTGRFENADQLMEAIKARLGEFDRFAGPYL